MCSTNCEALSWHAAACVEQGGKWLTYDRNFDNIGSGMMTLLEISTTEGWVDVMYQGQDATLVTRFDI